MPEKGLKMTRSSKNHLFFQGLVLAVAVLILAFCTPPDNLSAQSRRSNHTITVPARSSDGNPQSRYYSMPRRYATPVATPAATRQASSGNVAGRRRSGGR